MHHYEYLKADNFCTKSNITNMETDIKKEFCKTDVCKLVYLCC